MDPRKLSVFTIVLMFVHVDRGPSSINPETNKAYGASFPMLSVEDLVRAQFSLLKQLGIDRVTIEYTYNRD
jgi:homoserine O-acetyltransferase/O-succinyltransferase